MSQTQIYNTKTFTDIFVDYSTFKTEYTSTQKFPMLIDAADSVSHVSNLQILYYLLYSKFGNSPIANLDENQFKTKVGAIIWQYGPAWEKKLEIQDDIRDLTASDLLTGSYAIHKHAYNPATEPSNDDLNYVNDQNTTQYKKSKMDAYGQLWNLIVTDVTEEFLARFKPLFQKAINLKPYLFESED